MPWADGRSWAEGIEKGISNFGQYLDLKTDASRSGRGIQNDSRESGLSFSPMPYISNLIEDFEKFISAVNKQRIV